MRVRPYRGIFDQHEVRFRHQSEDNRG
jgi:hypothetical protein